MQLRLVLILNILYAEGMSFTQYFSVFPQILNRDLLQLLADHQAPVAMTLRTNLQT